MRRIGVIFVAVWIVVAAAAAGAPPAQAAEPIRIGAIFSVTGPASFLGEPERNTVKMLEEDLNKAGGLSGRKLEVIVYDDESDATKAVTAVDRLIKRDRVVAIVGPSTSGSTLAIIPKVEEAKIPLVSCAAAQEDRGAGQALGVQGGRQRHPGGQEDLHTTSSSGASPRSPSSPPRMPTGPAGGRTSRSSPPRRGSPSLPTRCSAPRTPT